MASPPPASDEFTLTQPDGYTFSVVNKGNIHDHWLETQDGLRVIEQDGWWHYAEPGEDGEPTRGYLRVGAETLKDLRLLEKYQFSRKNINEKTYSFDIPEGPVGNTRGKDIRLARKLSANVTASGKLQRGVKKNLVILVSFSDIKIKTPVERIHQKYFGETGSVKAYYDEISYGQVEIAPANESDGVNDGIISISLQSPHPNFGRGTRDNFPIRSRLFSAVLNATAEFVDFSTFDADGDGWITPDELAINIITAGFERAYGGSASPKPNLWAHVGGARPVELDDVKLNRYAIMGEINARRGKQYDIAMGLISHELGHLIFNLPDLYDYDYDSAGVGYWGLMAAGSWLRNDSGEPGSAPAHMLSWSKIQAGFMQPQDAKRKGDIILPALNKFPDAVRIVPDDEYLVVNKNQDGVLPREYFLLENRKQQGGDAQLPGHGLLISHIDSTVFNNNNQHHKMVDIEAADGLKHLDRDLNRGDQFDTFNEQNGNRFTDDTLPSAQFYSGADSGISVTDISEVGGEVSAKIEIKAGKNNHIRYDKNDEVFNLSPYVSDGEAWTALRITNPFSDFNQLDGVDIFSSRNTDINFYLYEALEDGHAGQLLFSSALFQLRYGWNRLLFREPQSFPYTQDVVLVAHMKSEYGFGIQVDRSAPPSGRSFVSFEEDGAFSKVSGNLKQVALMSLNTAIGNDDRDGDGVIDREDAYPEDPSEWADTDLDGIGNKLDTDDDNDGLPDVFEIQYNLNSTDHSDAIIDRDGDGFTNFEEFQMGTDPAKANDQPDGVDALMGFEPASHFLGWQLPPEEQEHWQLDESEFFAGQHSLKVMHSMANESTVIRYSDVFSDGFISFYYKALADIDGSAALYIDGERAEYLYERGKWERVEFPIEAGAHTVEWRLNTYSGAETPLVFWLDNVSLPVLRDPQRDSDGDGVVDLNDRLPFNATEWKDTDSDGTGDSIDTDNDNDGLPDEFETQYGLNPFDAGDAELDTDGDGFSHYEEFLAETNPLQINSRPHKLTGMLDFEQTAHLPGWELPPEEQGHWQLDEKEFFAGQRSLKVMHSMANESTVIRYRDVFLNGSISFYYKTLEGIDGSAALYIDGEPIRYLPERESWQLVEFPIEAGPHTIEWRFTTYFGAETPLVFWLDNVSLPVLRNPQRDSDGDGVADINDRLPFNATEWQDTDGDGTGDNIDTDNDNDGLPDEFETQYGLNPFDAGDAGLDTDGDGFSHYEEFLAETNPRQANSRPHKLTGMFDFEQTSHLPGWELPSEEQGHWQLDEKEFFEGQHSLKVMHSMANENTVIRYRDVFLNGSISFYYKTLEASGPFDGSATLYIDGEFAGYLIENEGWQLVELPIEAGPHTIEWRVTTYFGAETPFAFWLDDVTVPLLGK